MNVRNISFAFQLQGRPGVLGSFECDMQKEGGQTEASTNFTACVSPKSYPDLDDGSYVFSVRAQGEQVADSRKFTKARLLGLILVSSIALSGSICL